MIIKYPLFCSVISLFSCTFSMDHSKEMLANHESNTLALLLEHYLTTDQYGAREIDFSDDLLENNTVVLKWIISSKVTEFNIEGNDYQRSHRHTKFASIMDPWGRPYRLEVKVNPEKLAADGSISAGFYVVKVWSLGENGIREEGGGDDIENER